MLVHIDAQSLADLDDLASQIEDDHNDTEAAQALAAAVQEIVFNADWQIEPDQRAQDREPFGLNAAYASAILFGSTGLILGAIIGKLFA